MCAQTWLEEPCVDKTVHSYYKKPCVCVYITAPEKITRLEGSSMHAQNWAGGLKEQCVCWT